MKKTITAITAVLLCVAHFAFAQETASQTAATAAQIIAPAQPSAAVQVDANAAKPEDAGVVESVFVPNLAILPFEARGRQAENNQSGKNFSELLFVNLLEGGVLDMVERSELDKVLDELHLSSVGMVSPSTQLQLGQLLGAKILVTGSIFESNGKKYAVAKIIGSETSRVIGCSVNGSGEYEDLVTGLAERIQNLLIRNVENLLPPKATVFSAADKLAKVQGNGRKVFLYVKENLHEPTEGSASGAALKRLLLSLGFQPVETRADAELMVACIATATSAGKYQKFSSAVARVELAVGLAKEGKVLSAIERKETIAGATYLSAAQDAITQATLKAAADALKVLK